MTTRTQTEIKKCECGRRMSRDATRCTKCYEARRQAYLAEARSIVATGKCPDCGRPLRRNSSMAGWWQCSRLGVILAIEWTAARRCGGGVT